MNNFIKVYCPHCGKWLLSADKLTTGLIKPFCKFCKKEIIIKLPIKNTSP